MRRIAAAQVATLVAGMVLGNDTSADENIPTLPTVSATGSYNTVTSFGWTINNVNITSSTRPMNIGNHPSTISAEHQKALDCAKKYTSTGPGANSGPKPGSLTYISGGYGFWRKVNGISEVRSMLTNTPPAGSGWISAAGVTVNGNISFAWKPNNPTFLSMLETLSHEWAHQWGAKDLYDGSWNDADAIGKAAVAAYLADNGQKCGGL